MDAFLERCAQASAYTGEWELEEVVESIETSLWEQDTNQEVDAPQDTLDTDIPGKSDPSWSNYLLEDILNSQEQRLEQKKQLEQNSDYNALDLIQEMFERFDGRLEYLQPDK
jgi:hypothetical protein